MQRFWRWYLLWSIVHYFILLSTNHELPHHFLLRQPLDPWHRVRSWIPISVKDAQYLWPKRWVGFFQCKGESPEWNKELLTEKLDIRGWGEPFMSQKGHHWHIIETDQEIWRRKENTEMASCSHSCCSIAFPPCKRKIIILALNVFRTSFLKCQFINKDRGGYVAMDNWNKVNSVIVAL